MEPMAAFFDEEWESLSRMFSTEDAEFMIQQHGHESLSNDSDSSLFFQTAANFWPVGDANIENVAGVGESFLCCDNTIDYSNFLNVSQDSSSSNASDTSIVFPNLSYEFHQASDINVFQVTNGTPESMDFNAMDEKNDNSSVPVFLDGLVEDIISPREVMGSEKMNNAETQPASNGNSANELLLKRKFKKSKLQTEAEPVENSKKKSRVPRNVQKTKRIVQPKSTKNQKAQQINKDEEEANGAQNGQSSCSYSSEDDSNASQESNGGEASDNKGPALNLNGKTRASRGSATDPQSLYARRRRERINERLRILQNLIPNGTKVDISTMLEEAVHYVKFLQLQIKLLSSDDMWMYAPIVYNGLDIGLYGRTFPTL
ncbi:uncharacterized protein [Coffea arabica]|uniref:BHLH domain-containing protein n=1 Tax=Coffea arabica TaxID=13443 RepID=A0A6P6UWR4_COFAR|nr:transcription factor bHLH85-like [Coffea arabica]